MKKYKILTLFIFISAIASAQNSLTDSASINTPNLSAQNWGRGFDFTPKIDVKVTHLGKKVPNNNPGATYVWRIWRNDSGTVVHEQTTTSAVGGDYTYEPVTGQPLFLKAGVRYILTLYANTSGYYFQSSSQIDTNFIYHSMRYCNSCYGTLGFPNNTLSNFHYGAPDLWYVAFPYDQVICSGQNAIFNVNENTADSFRWQENRGLGWSDIPSSNDDTLMITNPPDSFSGYTYRCLIFKSSVTDTTSSALLTINIPVQIIDEPNDTTLSAGDAYFIVAATGTISGFQWQADTSTGWYNISGAVNDTLIVSSVADSMDGYKYRCIVSGICGNDTSQSATLSVNSCTAANITTEASNDTLCAGSNTLFGLTATGTITGYQWQRNTGGGWVNMGGQTNDTLIELNVTTTMNGYAYRCIVTGDCGNDTSTVVNLVVWANPNITGITSSLNPSYNGYAPMQCSNLTANTTGGTGSYTYTWSPAGTGNPLNVCPTSGTWYTATVTDVNGCQDTMSIKQYVIDATSTYPGRVTMCVKNNRTNRYSTLPVLLSSVPYYLNLPGAGNTLGACGAVPSKQGDAGYDDFADWYRIFPNPFANELNIEFMQMFEEDVRLSLTDLTGRVLKVIYHGKLYEGELVHFSLDASDLSSGMYLIRYESNTDMRVNKVQLVR